MKKYLRLIICCIGGLVACDNKKLYRELELFTSKEIIVPNFMRQMIAGKDSILLNASDKTVKLIVWVDSVSCSTCRVDKMLEYTETIRFYEETGGDFVPIFVFSPPRAKIRNVLLRLNMSQFEYPVFIDEHQAFQAENPHIPVDSRFHTFLLNKNGKVVLVGDPVNNLPLWELYKTTIITLIENGEVMPYAEKAREEEATAAVVEQAGAAAVEVVGSAKK
jgi:hypothetical protein